MKQTSFIGALLTLLMFLLVLAAAVFFLADRKSDLEATLAQSRADGRGLEATRDQLASEVAVRQAAYDSAEGTRAALTTQVEVQVEAAATLEAALEMAQHEATAVAERLAESSVEVFIFSPRDGAILSPGQTVELIVAAQAEGTLETVTLSVNDQVLETYPVEGQAHFTNRVQWIPADEGSYDIRLSAMTGDGRAAASIITVQAQYLDQDARVTAMLGQVIEDIVGLRFPGGAPEGETGAMASPALDGAPFSAATTFSQTLFLRAFDLVPPAFDLTAFELALSQQSLLVAYNPGSGTAVPFSAAEAVGPVERWLAAPRAGRALQEMYLARQDTLAAAVDQDSQLAIRAMAEGEGAFLQFLYTDSGLLGEDELQAVDQILSMAPPDVLAQAPEYLIQSLLFPVEAGFAFIEAAYEADGVGGLDALWQSPPISSEQILHPERYRAGERPLPTELAPADELLEAGWQRVLDDSLGEFHLGQYLAQHLDETTAQAAADGWGGGRYALYWHADDEALVLLLRLAWDSPADRQTFRTTFADYAAARTGAATTPLADDALCWSAEVTLCLSGLGPDTLVVQAPDSELAGELLAANLLGSQEPAPAP
jgi:hypothetical protein